MSTINWSPQQNAIFEWFANGEGSLVVRARAGTGKTTTIVQGIKHAPADQEILLCAFNKRIAEELAAKLDHPQATAQTLHSLGFQAVKMFWENIRLESRRGERAESLARRAAGDDAPDAMVRLVAKLHTKGREIAPLAKRWEDLEDLAWQFDCIPDKEWEHFEWNAERVMVAALKAMELAEKRPTTTGIDFTDMIFLPVRNNWLRPRYDVVVVDECQDMNACQIEIARRLSRGRICVVGDDRQAIYGFRGADSESLDRLKAELDAAELGLTTTYRCGQLIVAEAQRFVPDYQAAPDNAAGNVTSLPSFELFQHAKPGDAVLSRVNAPLIGTCLKAIQRGIPARVEGRDIAAGLRKLIRELAKGPARNSMPAFLERLGTWEDREVERIERSKIKTAASRIDAVRDKADAIRVISEGARGIAELQRRLDQVFEQVGLGNAIVFSSVHKAKGLEWDRVFVLQDTLRDGDIEEDNISYVAITRAKDYLGWVVGPGRPKASP